MYIKIFEYGYDWKNVLSFIEWWIKSENCSKDIKIGDIVNERGKAIRDVEHTILVTKNRFELMIEKSAIMSDGPPRKLKDHELYLNKSWFGLNGFDITIKKTKKWLQKNSNHDPYTMNLKKAKEEELNFDTIGIGFFVETNSRQLHIIADVIGIPK
jgi:hypothetical protein